MNYPLSTIANIVCGKLTGEDRTVTSVATDSRNVLTAAESTLFVAIPGERHDGHHYIPRLYRQGVRSFLVQQIPPGMPTGHQASFIFVSDSLRALQELAAHHRGQYAGTVVGITGSNGKTIVKEWIAQLWPEGAGKILRSPRSYNSQLGVALSLLMIEGDEKLVVIEAGISQPGEMERLQQMIRPHIGILTNLGQAHQENFTSPEQKAAEKSRLFTECERVIFHDNDSVKAYLPELNLYGWQDDSFDLPSDVFPDKPSRENASHALTLYRLLGITPKSPDELRPIAMRLELQDGIQGSMLLNDTYNSDLTSLGIALDYLSQQAGDRPKSVILSDILQSGEDSRELYNRVARLLDAHGITDFTGIGPEISASSALLCGPARTCHFYTDTTDFIRRADKSRFAGHYILIKGSRPFGFERISRMLEKRTHTTTLEVDLSAMTENLRFFRRHLAPQVKTMAMVKAYSYGSGSVEVARHLEQNGIDYLAVAFADEGISLREGGIHLPIVVLNSDPGSFAVMADYNLEPEIYSFSSLENYIREMQSRGIIGAPIHLKLDTGMHRLGFPPAEAGVLIERLLRSDSVRVRSIFSHMAAAEDPAEDEFSRRQSELFRSTANQIREALADPSILLHFCNSNGIIRHPDAHFDMVRIGVGLYGVSIPGLKTVCRLKTQIVQIKELGPGETVGYNRKGIIDKPMRIATLPIGYADGLDRHLGNGKTSVNIRETLCPTIGNISMDTCMVDVTALPQAQEGDTAIIFGDNPTADDLAASLGTIGYEILTSVSARIKRIYTKE